MAQNKDKHLIKDPHKSLILVLHAPY